jgi:hypothetical protein
MMETIRFGLLEPDFYLRRVLPKTEEILRKTNLGTYSNQPRFPQSLLFTFGGWSGSGPGSTISVFHLTCCHVEGPDHHPALQLGLHGHRRGGD